MKLVNRFIGTILLCMLGVCSFGQDATVPVDLNPESDVNTLRFDFDMQRVLEILDDRHNNPTAQNALVGDFITANEIPMKGMYGLNRRETWYNWFSHRQDKAKALIILDQSLTEE